MTARYTTDELTRLASDRGPFAVDNMRQALIWAAQTLQAADAAVNAERERAVMLQFGLHSIADRDPVELALDPQWSQRMAKATLAQCGVPARFRLQR